MPELYDTRNYLQNVPEEEIEMAKEECIFYDKNIPCDKDVFELCEIVLQEGEIELTQDPFDALNVYMYLRTKILEIL